MAFVTDMPSYSQSDLRSRNAALGQILRAGETSLYILILVFFSGAVIGLLFTDLSNLESAGEFARKLWFPIYGLIAGLVILCLGKMIRLAVFSPIILICVLICGMSFFWSIDPGVTLRRSIALMMTTVAGFALAARYDWSQMLQRIAFVFLILAVMTVLVVLIMPERGIMQEIHVGAWRGPFVEKNYLGGAMSKGVIAALCAFAVRPDRGWLWVPTFFLCFAMVLLSTSKTSLLVSTAGTGLFVALYLYRRFFLLRLPIVGAMILGVVGFVILMAAFPVEMFALIGKDPSLTGRTDIWSLLMLSIQERPWLGFGYGTYWTDPLGPSYWVRTALEWGVPNSHNGWMETALSCGIVVVGFFALQYVITLVLSLQRIKFGGTETYWAVLYTLMFLGQSMSESAVLQQNDLSWVLFVATASKLFAGEKPFWRANHPRWKRM